MSALEFCALQGRERVGLKGPRAAEWLAARGIPSPALPNSWIATSGAGGDLLVARLGGAEFFLEEAAGGGVLPGLSAALQSGAPGAPAAPAAPGVYPVLREDAGFRLSGDGVHDALAQVCNVNFAGLDLAAQPVVMTLMIGVAVLVVPEGSLAERTYRFWCDPTFAPSLSEELGGVIAECGGLIKGVTG